MQKDSLKKIKADFVRSANILRNLFKSQGNKLGYREQGYSLNGNALTRSFVSARSCRENNDRYTTQVRKPVAKAVFSFAIDFSGSMCRGAGQDSYFPRCSTWEKVIGALYGVSHVAESVGILSKIAFIEFEKGHLDLGIGMGESQRNVIKGFNDKAWTEEYAIKVADTFSPRGGDDLAEYARHAIAMVENESAEYKVAFFMTDGMNSYSHEYYNSLNELAKAKGVKLIGISFGVALNKLMPNGILVNDSNELAKAMVKELEKLF